MLNEFLTRIGWEDLGRWKALYQDFQFYIATLLAFGGGLYGWYRARTSFQRSARLSEIVIETTGIGTRVAGSGPGSHQHYLWISPLKQVQLGDLFNLLYIKSIARGGRYQVHHKKTVIKLKLPSQTKAMLLRIRAAAKELWPESEIVSSAVVAGPNLPTPYQTETFYAFLRRDSWTDDRYQSYRIIMIPKWIVERTISQPGWLDLVQIDIKHQSDRLDHIRYLARHKAAIDRGPDASGVIAVDFHFEAPRK